MWIRHIPYGEAEGRLKTLYDRVKGPDDNVDNIMLAHSLRPHSMEGHMALYKYVLHHASNTTPKWFLETIGVLVSSLNACDYCVEHHFAGLKRLLRDDDRAAAIRRALAAGAYDETFTAAEAAGLRYAETLTLRPRERETVKACVEAMRSHGVDDGRILEINQVAAYFNYANRTVTGLGITTDGDILGLSPNNSNDPNDWSHA
ncbi:carboxymuconolactone decarboxylase family protein [Phreatobacter sp. AB_2022a]|uniref:carboxymuconolactone decarboxylase family protein n=1 Tax=Phreatobacter sp. AB_2022a TaxID=3003134 RepID=UPI0022874996|nr:carboxymuconolactone decarboxylase family protein [Phreatobacter sp. AB_2022a]MCZ0736319.1 carboxymuconolactone decarboxylase family protein [Phreatobacter sp. AB_2022a]